MNLQVNSTCERVPATLYIEAIGHLWFEYSYSDIKSFRLWESNGLKVKEKPRSHLQIKPDFELLSHWKSCHELAAFVFKELDNNQFWYAYMLGTIVAIFEARGFFYLANVCSCTNVLISVFTRTRFRTLQLKATVHNTCIYLPFFPPRNCIFWIWFNLKSFLFRTTTWHQVSGKSVFKNDTQLVLCREQYMANSSLS